MANQNIPNLFPNPDGVELFDEFFESGKEETVSPFLTPDSRGWGHNIMLKGAFVGIFFLLIAYGLTLFYPKPPLIHLSLLLTYFFAGIPSLISAIEDIVDLEINIDVLMTLAAFLAVLIGSAKEGALLLVLFAISGAMEHSVKSRAKGAISSLKKLSPTKAFVLREDGTLIQRSVKDITKGTKIHVKAGEMVPLDGRVIAGASSVNLVHLTGENMPVTRTLDDEVAAGAQNLEGALTLEVTHTSSDSTLARIIQLITQAQEAKPRLQRWFDRLSNIYAMSIISLSLIFALLLPWVFSIPYLGNEGSIYRALAFLIAASPCALILAIPIAYLSAIGACARRGILLKGGMALDALASCRIMALDKTGTITKGELNCLGIIPIFEKDGSDPLPVALALEQNAVHPIAEAIVNYAHTQKVTPASVKDFELVPGYGLRGQYVEKEVLIGNAELILPKLSDEQQAQVHTVTSKIAQRGELYTLLLLDQSLYCFHFKDTVRPGMAELILGLKAKWDMTCHMLTGDHLESATAVAKEVGISNYHANLRPEDKLNYISKLAKKENLAMVGDGINDAPALARATVGISMGKGGSKTAVDNSDIVLMQDDIEKLQWLVDKAHKTGQIVKQNVALAAIAIVIATVPALLGWIPLWAAVVLHEGGTVIVGLNALRLLR